MASIFLSHSSLDKVACRRLAGDLTRNGHRVWFDETSIPVGESIPSAIERGIDESEFLIVLLSARSVNSQWVDREWKQKYWDEVQRGTVAVLPVRLDDCKIPGLLKTKKFADFAGSWELGLNELLGAIRYFATLRRDNAFYGATAQVWSEERSLTSDQRVGRAQYWDKFAALVDVVEDPERLRVQRENTRFYLHKYGLTVRQLKQALRDLESYDDSVDNDLDERLIDALVRFQVAHSLRHHDGVFGPVTYLKMAELAKIREGGA